MISRHSLTTVAVLTALLLSSWSNVIAAAFCPRYLSNRGSCVKHLSSQAKQVESRSCHHQMMDMGDMADMNMDEMPMETDDTPDSKSNSSTEKLAALAILETSTDLPALALPDEQCAHCWMHSQPTSGSVNIVAGDSVNRLVETDAHPVAHNLASLSAVPIFITPSEHGPPGTALPRHVLINVFRI